MQKQETYESVFCILAVDFPKLFNPIKPLPLSFTINSQLYTYYDKKLSSACIHHFLGKWTNRIEYHKAILRELYRFDIIHSKTDIEHKHKRHSLNSIQQMLKPPE